MKRGNAANRRMLWHGMAAMVVVMCLLTVQAAEGVQVAVAWDLPTQNEDGSPLEDLVGVRFHYGAASGGYTSVIELPGAATQCVVTGLVEGATYYFAAKAYNSDGVESAFSEELVWTTQDVTPPVIEGVTELLINEDGEGGALLPDVASLLTITDNLTLSQNIVVTQTPAEGTRVTTGTTVVTVTAADAAGNSSEHTITVTVNARPLADAGSDQSIRLPDDTVALNGTVSDDALPSGGSLTVAWSKVSGPGTVIFADALAADTAATFSEEGTYVLRLTVSDGELSATDEVTIVVKRAKPNPPRNLRVGA